MLAKIRAERLTREVMSTALEEYNITLMEWLAVGALYRNEKSLTSSQLAKELDVSKSYITKLTTQLHNKKLIDYTVSPEDKRVTFISLSDGGQKLISDSEPIVRRALAEWLKPIDREHVEIYMQVIVQVAKNL